MDCLNYSVRVYLVLSGNSYSSLIDSFNKLHGWNRDEILSNLAFYIFQFDGESRKFEIGHGWCCLSSTKKMKMEFGSIFHF